MLLLDNDPSRPSEALLKSDDGKNGKIVNSIDTAYGPRRIRWIKKGQQNFSSEKNN